MHRVYFALAVGLLLGIAGSLFAGAAIRHRHLLGRARAALVLVRAVGLLCAAGLFIATGFVAGTLRLAFVATAAAALVATPALVWALARRSAIG